MPLKNMLTNEKLNKKFDNPFALVNYAISLAKLKLERKGGLDLNPVNEVLESILKDGDQPKDSEQESDT